MVGTGNRSVGRSRSVPQASSDEIHRRMSTQRRRDTAPELAIRRILHARGHRYRVDFPLPGLRRRADLAFTRSRLIVFVDGCYWHLCPLHRTLPKRNAGWWLAKLEANAARDRDTDERLAAAGWNVLRVWEHEDPNEAADRVEALLTDAVPPRG